MASVTRRLLLSVTSVSGCAALFPTNVEELQQLAIGAKENATAALEKVYALEDRSFDATAIAIDRAVCEFSITSGVIAVAKETNVDKAMREEAAKAAVDLKTFSVDNFTNNRKLYKALKAVEEKEGGSLSTDRSYWLKEEIASYERQGMNLPDDKFERVVALQKKIGELSTKFSTNISEDKTTITVSTLDELKGVPESIIESLKRGDGDSYILGMDYPTYFGVMKNCEVAETRLRMSQAFENRAYPLNHAVLNEVIALRHEVATLLGFESYAHYDLASKMAKEPKVAREFIEGLVPRLQQKWADERKELIADLHPSVQLNAEGYIRNCDLAFAMNEYKKAKLNVSETKIQEYFPMESTVDALFKIYESFFDVTFARVATDESEKFWHEEVSALSVTDNRTKELLGHVIMDLFPREGKFSHACCFPLVPAILQPDGKMTPAVSVVLANFPKPQGDRPALFLYDDVKTFFHEFGHAIHGLMGRTEMATVAGTRVKRDFVELPSQMLEEWLWEPEVLQLITCHYQTKEKLPMDLIEAKVRSKNAFTGRDALSQLQFATLSLELFSKDFASQKVETMDPADLFRKIQPKILDKVEFSQENNFHCNFGHLMGYAATYYGYMWSEVFALDVFEHIRQANGLLSAELGRRYVDCIIGRGGAEDPNELLKKFLGREPNQDAFLKRIGLTQ